MGKIGYARVSTSDQHPEIQEQRLREAGCERVFQDKGVSGMLASRPAWDQCLAFLRPGDQLTCVRLDRIGRSVKNLIDVVAELGGRGIDLAVLDQGIDTATPAGKMLFHVVAAVAEFEHDLISERTRDALASTTARGRSGGPKFKLRPHDVAYAREQIGAKKQTAKAVAQELGVSRQTLYRALEATKREPATV